MIGLLYIYADNKPYLNHRTYTLSIVITVIINIKIHCNDLTLYSKEAYN